MSSTTSLKYVGVAVALSVAFGFAQIANANTIVLTFEGGGDEAAIENFYNGGTDSQGNSGTNYGIAFGPDSLSIISELAGGSGNFQGAPSGKTIAFFLTGPGDVMNVAAGFNTGFSFYYSATQVGSVTVYTGLDGTGTLLATIALSINAQNHCAAGATTTYCSWDPVGVTFAGTAESVIFSGVANYIGFDDVTLGSPTPGVGALCGPGQTLNQKNVACAIDNFVNNGGTLTAAFMPLYTLPAGQLAAALTQLSGEAATGAVRVGFELTNEFLALMLDPFVKGRIGGSTSSVSNFAPDDDESLPPDLALAYAKVLKKAPMATKAPPLAPDDQGWSAWGSAFGGSNHTSGDSAVVGSHDVSAQTYSFAAGMDYHRVANTTVGFALAGGGTNWGLSQGLGGGRSDAFQAGVYGTTRSGPAYIAASLAFTNHWMSTDRYAFAGDNLGAKFNAQSYGARVEAGYRYATPIVTVTPYAALQPQTFHTPNYQETDLTGGGFGLAYNAANSMDTRTELGARFDKLTMLGSMPLMLNGRAAWAYDSESNPALFATFQALPGASFIVNGATPVKNSLLSTAGAELFLTTSLKFIAKVDGQFARNSETYSGSGTLRYEW